jgi:hypothetical protein
VLYEILYWCAEDFFALKNPTALARFEPANSGTKGQHTNL